MKGHRLIDLVRNSTQPQLSSFQNMDEMKKDFFHFPIIIYDSLKVLSTHTDKRNS